MKNNISLESMPMLIVILSLTCAIGAAGLAITYNLTRKTIDQTMIEEQNAAVRTVLPESEGTVEKKIIEIDGEAIPFFIVKDGFNIIGYATIASHVGYGGAVDVMVGLLPNGTISGVKLLAHQETPGLGAKAGNDAFQKQFVDKHFSSTKDKLVVIKPGETTPDTTKAIHAITAATITSKAYTAAVNTAVKRILENKERLA